MSIDTSFTPNAAEDAANFDISGLLDDVLERLQGFLDDLYDLYLWCWDALDAAVWKFWFDTEEWRRKLQTAYDDVVAKIQDFGLKAQGLIIDMVGDPKGLVAIADDYSDVSRDLGTVAGQINLNGLLVDDHWTGPAADAYKNMLVPQANALIGLQKALGSAHTVLYASAGGLVSLGVRTLTLVVDTALAVIAELSSVTDPSKWVGFLTETGFRVLEDAVNGLNAFLNAMVGFASDRLQDKAAIDQAMDGQNAFHPGPHDGRGWPVSASSGTLDDPGSWTPK